MTGNNTKSDFSARTESKSAPVSQSTFDLSYHHFMTPSYARITPFLKLEGVSGDDLTIRNNSKIRSYTLKSPLMSDVYMQKDYFSVPMEAILPQNWNKIFTNPVIGDDVNAKQCNCLLNPSLVECSQLINLAFSSFEQGAGWQPHKGLNALFLCEKFLSKGSLFSLMGINLWSCLQIQNSTITDAPLNVDLQIADNSDFDDIEDLILGWFRSFCLSNSNPITCKYIEVDSSLSSGYSEKTKSFSPSYVGDTTYFEDFLDFAREHYLTDFAKSGVTSQYAFKQGNVAYNPIDVWLNISSIAAYQIVCAHYFTNDRIDYIYSAELYRQMMRGFCVGYSNVHFSYNGVETLYDELSAKWIDTHLYSAYESITTPSVEKYNSFYYIVNLLSFNNSLRFSDYFTGSRLTPLAVGNTDISVDTNVVSVIDISRNIQIQRFLNLVNKTGRKFEEYVSKLFGTYVKPDFHNPSYLGKVRDKVVSYETENTADAQQSKSVSVTSSFNQTSSNFAFEFHCDRPSIIIGVCSFDIPRVYSRIIERDALHYDRFDYFNPFMQFIGDQEVRRIEISPSTGPNWFEPWGYQSRYAEYKTRLPICSGGFSKQNVLPSWQFVADSDMNTEYEQNIDPSYIRSRRSELDKFYLSLNGESPATRFHFIVDMHNNVVAKRNMVANPNIL